MKFKAPENFGGITIAGSRKSFKPGKDGVLEIPDIACTDALVADLASHGCIHIEDKPEPEPTDDKPKA